MQAGRGARKELSPLTDGSLSSGSDLGGGGVQAAASLPFQSGRDDGSLHHPTGAERRCVTCNDIRVDTDAVEAVEAVEDDVEPPWLALQNFGSTSLPQALKNSQVLRMCARASDRVFKCRSDSGGYLVSRGRVLSSKVSRGRI